MIGLIVAVLLFLLLGSGGIAIGSYFYKKAFDAKSEKPFILVDKHEIVTKDDKWYLQDSHYQRVTRTSKDGLKLCGSMIKQDSRKWVILVHGYMGRLEDMIPQAHAFYERGYNILLVDLRGHGKSEGKVIGFGYLDHFDLLDWCAFLKEEQASSILLYGVSMGASSVMMCADEVDPLVSGIIEDCGYASLQKQLVHMLKHQLPKVPPKFLLCCLSLVLYPKAKYHYRDANCLPHVANARVPMLFLHGERDSFIEPSMMEELYETCGSDKMKLLIPKARHASSAKINPQIYWETIDHFLKEKA